MGGFNEEGPLGMNFCSRRRTSVYYCIFDGRLEGMHSMDWCFGWDLGIELGMKVLPNAESPCASLNRLMVLPLSVD